MINTPVIANMVADALVRILWDKIRAPNKICSSRFTVNELNFFQTTFSLEIEGTKYKLYKHYFSTEPPYNEAISLIAETTCDNSGHDTIDLFTGLVKENVDPIDIDVEQLKKM